MVVLVLPQGSEDKEHLHKDGSKWHNSSKSDKIRAFEVPFLFRDGRGNRGDAAGEVWCSAPIASHHRSKKGERDGNDAPQSKNDEEGHNRDGRGRTVRPTDNVEEEIKRRCSARQQAGSHKHGTNPLLTAIAEVVGARSVSSDERGESVANHENGDDGAALGVETNGKHNDEHREDSQLKTGSNEGREDGEVRRCAENIAVNEFPSGL